jgi:hypothetical protein
VTALRLLAEERQDGLVPERFRVEPVQELRVGILAMADLGHRTELQNSRGIFDRMLARQSVCIHRVWQKDDELARYPARERLPQAATAP